MKRSFLMMVTVVFIVAITAILLSPTGYAFWYGDKLSENLSDEGQALHNYLVEEVMPDLNPGFFGGPGPLDMPNAIPENVKGVTIPCQPGKCWDGYTILSAVRNADGNGAVLIDMDGNVINKWPFPFAFPAKMFPWGYVMGQFSKGVGPGGGNALDSLVTIDWCGREVWSWSGADGQGSAVHHDFQKSGNPVGYYAPHQYLDAFEGKTLILTNDYPPGDDTAHISDQFRLLDDVFIELDENDNVIWEWHAWEHFDEADCDGRPGCLGMGFDEIAKEAIRTIQVGPFRTDDDPPEPASDWTHMNSLSYVGYNKWYSHYGDQRFHPENVIWDGRTNNIIAIVARYDHPDGTTWKSGDIVWRVGPNYSYGNPDYKVAQIIGPHMAHIIPAYLPGGGNCLVFDNGGTAGLGSYLPGLPPAYPNTFRDYSRVTEFNPITLEIKWEYKNPRPKEGERMFYSRLISGAQRLLNGNTLITEGGNGRVFEVDKKGKIVWEYVNEHGGGGGGPPIPAFSSRAVYRAYRVPYDWIHDWMLMDSDSDGTYDVCQGHF